MQKQENLNKMRLLITGGAGCLGSNLIEYYFPQGHEICVIDNFSTGKRDIIPEQARLKVVEGSIANAELVNTTFQQFKPTHVIHSAASYKDPQNWEDDALTNICGTINVAKASLNEEVQRFVNFQTALCYGRPKVLPITEESPSTPFTSYGISKTAGEAYVIESGLPFVSLRLSNICGPRLSIGPIPTFYKRLKASQSCYCSDTVRDFLDIKDFFLLMDKVLFDQSKNGVFNISTGEGRSIKDVYDTVAEYLGIIPPEVSVVPPGDDDVPEVVLDPSYVNEVFEWKAKTNFKETIANQLRWYDKYGITDIYSHLAKPE